jgi:hypothetical protein
MRQYRHDDFRHGRYQVVCKTACYVGQGLCFEYGHVLESYDSLADAEKHLAEVNADPRCIDCWELRELANQSQGVLRGKESNP